MASCGHRLYDLLQSVTVSGALKVPEISNNHVRKAQLLPRNAGSNHFKLFFHRGAESLDRAILFAPFVRNEKNDYRIIHPRKNIHLTL